MRYGPLRIGSRSKPPKNSASSGQLLPIPYGHVRSTSVVLPRRRCVREFSNFAAFPIDVGGTTWPTSEHYFQSQKFVGTPHEEEIHGAETPMKAANKARSRKRPLRHDWDDVRLDVMRTALRAKFTQHSELRALLLSTGDATIVEHTTNDAYWADAGDGTGENMLGKLLMELRSELGVTGLMHWQAVNGEIQVHFGSFMNHGGGRAAPIFCLFNDIAKVAPGSYGLLYVWDDEDGRRVHVRAEAYDVAAVLRHHDRAITCQSRRQVTGPQVLSALAKERSTRLVPAAIPPGRRHGPQERRRLCRARHAPAAPLYPGRAPGRPGVECGPARPCSPRSSA